MLRNINGQLIGKFNSDNLFQERKYKSMTQSKASILKNVTLIKIKKM